MLRAKCTFCGSQIELGEWREHVYAGVCGQCGSLRVSKGGLTTQTRVDVEAVDWDEELRELMNERP